MSQKTHQFIPQFDNSFVNYKKLIKSLKLMFHIIITLLGVS